MTSGHVDPSKAGQVFSTLFHNSDENLSPFVSNSSRMLAATGGNIAPGTSGLNCSTSDHCHKSADLRSTKCIRPMFRQC